MDKWTLKQVQGDGVCFDTLRLLCPIRRWITLTGNSGITVKVHLIPISLPF
jgi:hypothetical protein